MSEKARVLVVDDEEIVCLSVKRILDREGYEVETALNAAEAMEKIKNQNFDLVITDLMMPEKNGIEMMHAMKKNGVNVPFLMITGYPTIKTGIQALRLGAIDYLPKPFTRQELLAPVNRALKGEQLPEPELDSLAQDLPGKKEPILPGDRFILPKHSWAVFDQEGTLAVGVEDRFLKAVGKIKEIEAPLVNEMIEQGYPHIKLHAEDGTPHGVFMPFSGRVVVRNEEVINAPETISADKWLLRIIPAKMDEESQHLMKAK